MEWLNYHHLRYFWAVAREGSVTRAAERLHTTQPTVSAQLRLLQEAIGEQLFVRAGRGLSLTDTGLLVYRYADSIFSLGEELLAALKGHPREGAAQVRVGASAAIPKTLVSRILHAAMARSGPVRLWYVEEPPDRLLGDLDSHHLDVALSDEAAGPAVHAFSHLLGESGVSFLASPALARKHGRGFPRSLDGAPFVMRTLDSALRRSIDTWLDVHRIRPRIVAEVQDSGVLKKFAQEGTGVVVVTTLIEREVCRTHGLRVIGRTRGCVERYYAITVERKYEHPLVAAICRARLGRRG